MQDYDQKSGQQIGACHEGSEKSADLADPLDAAKNDDAGDHSQDHADDHRIYAELSVEGVGDGVGVDNSGDDDAVEEEQHGDELSEPGSVEALGRVVHGSADEGAVFSLMPVLDAQSDLSELGRHADDGRDDHPEQCSGTARSDGSRDSGYVSGPDDG